MTTHSPPASQTVSISPEEFSRLKKSGENLVLVDVRTDIEFAEIHAEGAIHYPLQTLNPSAFIQSCGALNQTIVFICKGGKRGNEACQKVLDAGYTNAVNLAGGTDAWVAAGLPTISDHKVISLERQVRIAAGALVVLGIALGFAIHRALFGISAFVGSGLVFAGLTDWCGMGLLIAKMPWNRKS